MKIPLKTAFLIVFLATIAGLLYYVALQPQKPATTNSNADQNKPQTKLSIGNTKKDASGKYYSQVSIDTKTNKITSIQLELSYDNKLLKDVTISAGSFFDSQLEFLKTVDEQNGRISYALGLPANSEGISGIGIVAIIYYNPVFPNKDTISSISFLPKTEVNSSSFAGSALKGTFDAVVNIKALATPTPTPRPTFQPISPSPESKNPNPTIEIPPPPNN